MVAIKNSQGASAAWANPWTSAHAVNLSIIAFLHFCVPIFIGSVLLCAASLKAYQLISEPAVTEFWLDLLVVPLETILALCLFFNWKPQWTRKAGLAMFIAFLTYSFHHLVAGARTCGCMGNVEVKPWLSLIFDLGALLALFFWIPQSLEKRPSFARSRFVAILCLVIIPLIALSDSGLRYPSLIIATPQISLRKITQGERYTFSLSVSNPHDRPVIIDHCDTSCPCVQSQRFPYLVEPGKEAVIDLLLDLSQEPGFSGLLAISINGKTPADETALRAQVSVRVAAISE